MIRSVAYKRDTAAWLLGAASWDLAVIGFCELHPAGHYLWPAGAEGMEQANGTAFDPLREGLRRDRSGDRRPARGTARRGDRGRGQRRWRAAQPLRLAPDAGGLAPSRSHTSARGRARRRGRPPRGSLVGRIKQMVPPGARRLIADNLPWWLRDKLGAHLQSADIDWARTRAFALPTDLEGCIRINLKGASRKASSSRAAPTSSCANRSGTSFWS